MRSLARLALVSIPLVTSLAACDGKKDPAAAETKPAAEPAPEPPSERQRAKWTKEAKTYVPSIAVAVQTVFDERMQLVDSTIPELPASAPMTPEPGTCCKEPEGLCGIGKGDWGHPAWAALRFRPATPHRYSYEYVAEGKSFVVKAVGDLDCDGERSTYEIRGRITDSGELDIDREPTAANPLE